MTDVQTDPPAPHRTSPEAADERVSLDNPWRDPGEQPDAVRGRPWLPLVVLGLGLGLTASTAWWATYLYERWGRTAFLAEAQHAISHARLELQTAADAVHALAAFLQLPASPGPEEFDAFAATITAQSSSLTALAWIPLVTQQDLPAIAQTINTRAGGTLWSVGPSDARAPLSRRPNYAVVELVYPAQPHATVHGLDLLSALPENSPVRHTLLDQRASILGPVTLPWLPSNPSAIIVAAPVANTTRRGAASGFILLDTLLNDRAKAQAHPDITLHLAASAAKPFPGFHLEGDAPAPAATPLTISRLSYEEKLNVGDAGLTIRAFGDEASFLAGKQWTTWGILIPGAVVSFLAAGLVDTRRRAAARAATQARQLRHVNDSLRQSDERFRLALQAVDGVVYDWDASRNRAIRSGGLVPMLGYAPAELAPTLQGWLELIHPDDLALASARFQDAQRPGDMFSVEYRLRHKQGHYIDVWDRGVVVGNVGADSRRIVGCAISVTEQRRAERAVREAEERFAIFADAIDDVLWTIDLNPFRIVYLSPAFERLWGIPAAVMYKDSLAWLNTVHPDDREAMAASTTVWSTANAPRTRRIEFRIRRADGQVRWIQDSAVRIDDADGRPLRVIGIAEDITDRKLAQLAVQESEEAYRQFFDANLAIAIVFDPADGAIVQINAAAAAFYGLDTNSGTVLNVADICRADPADHTACSIRNPPPRFESRHRVANGELRDVEVFSSPIQRHGRRLVYSLIHDITERKRAEAALVESRRMLEQAHAVGRIGSWISDATPDGRLVWSREVYRIFGIRPETFDHQISTFFSLVHPDDLEMVKAATAEAIRNHSVYRIDHRIIRNDGEVRWVLEQGEVEYDASGAPVRIVGVVQDISERRQAEQALRDSRAELRSLLDSLTEGCLLISSDVTIIECNRSAEVILGIPRARLIGNTTAARSWNVFREDGTALDDAEFPSNSALQGREVDAMVLGLQDPTGKTRWLSVNARPLRSDADTPVGAVVSFTDITDRRAAAIALQHTALRYQLLFDANPEPLWVYDADTLRFLAVNHAAVQNYGYSADEFLSLSILDIRPPEERERLYRHLPTIIDQERLRGVWSHRVKDGRIIDVEVISHPVDFDGRRARIVLAKDITERLRSEQALRNSETRLREAQHIGNFGDWEYDFTSGRMVWSDEVFRLFRRDPQAGTPTFKESLAYYFPDDSRRLDDAVRNAVRHGRDAQIDLRVSFAGGESAWHRSVVRAVRDDNGKVISVKGIAQDITGRKLAEEALRATQLRLATILEHLPDLVVYESDGAHLRASDNILSLTGYSARAFEVDRSAFIRLIHPSDLKDAEEQLRRLRASRQVDPLVIQYRLRHRDGHYLWIEDRMVFERSEKGENRLLGVLIDITERKRLEQRQRLMMAELDHRVKNNLATVISLLDQTGRTAKSQRDFHHTFLGRLQALARMHKALSSTHWEGVALHGLVRQTLEAYQSEPPSRVQIVGEDVILPARAASPLAMALHELATNAAKYGALSVPHGRVHVEWTVATRADEARQLTLSWTETDGPHVTPPTEAGFGTELIQGGIAYELHGDARFEFLPGGVRCVLTVPLVDHPPIALPFANDL